jgi:hypothetical protein
MECWASILGDCSGPISREHYVSDGIFDGESVTAFGLSWCKTAPIQIGLGSAVAKVLCKRHNEALSPFDAEASRLSRFLSEHVQELPLEPAEHRANGHRLEKWALKTFANLAYIGALDQVAHTRTQPSDFVVEHIFRDAPLPSGVGLYFIAGSLNNTTFKVGLSWNGIRNLSAGGAIAAMTFTLNEVRFVVNVVPGSAERRLAKLGVVNGVDYSRTNIAFRPNNIVLRSTTAGEKKIAIDW